MELLFLIFLICIVIRAFSVDETSTSYRLGRGLGNKTRKFGEWLMKDD